MSFGVFGALFPGGNRGDGTGITPGPLTNFPRTWPLKTSGGDDMWTIQNCWKTIRFRAYGGVIVQGPGGEDETDYSFADAGSPIEVIITPDDVSNWGELYARYPNFTGDRAWSGSDFRLIPVTIPDVYGGGDGFVRVTAALQFDSVSKLTTDPFGNYTMQLKASLTAALVQSDGLTDVFGSVPNTWASNAGGTSSGTWDVLGAPLDYRDDWASGLHLHDVVLTAEVTDASIGPP